MAEVTTKVNDASVEGFLDTIPDERKRDDSRRLIELMREAMGEGPKMWGGKIIGFGSYHYVYESGREGDSPIISFSPRKEHLVLYISGGLDSAEDLLEKLGKYKRGKGCLYIKKLEDVDLGVLRTMLANGVKAGAEKHKA